MKYVALVADINKCFYNQSLVICFHSIVNWQNMRFPEVTEAITKWW